MAARAWSEKLAGLTVPIRRLRHAFASKPTARVLFLYLTSLGWILVWAWYDFVVVGLAFRRVNCPTCPPVDAQLYVNATWYVLYPIATLATFRTAAWLPILAVWLGGWEDILFYWIQGRPVPNETSWIFLAPTADLLYLKALLFLVLTIATEVAYQRLRRGPGPESGRLAP